MWYIGAPQATDRGAAAGAGSGAGRARARQGLAGRPRLLTASSGLRRPAGSRRGRRAQCGWAGHSGRLPRRHLSSVPRTRPDVACSSACCRKADAERPRGQSRVWVWFGEGRTSLQRVEHGDGPWSRARPNSEQPAVRKIELRARTSTPFCLSGAESVHGADFSGSQPDLAGRVGTSRVGSAAKIRAGEAERRRTSSFERPIGRNSS